VLRARRPGRPGARDQEIRLEASGVSNWDAVSTDAARIARDYLDSAPRDAPPAELEEELARRIGATLRRGARYRPVVQVVLD
jgi:hypothetical protein